MAVKFRLPLTRAVLSSRSFCGKLRVGTCMKALGKLNNTMKAPSISGAFLLVFSRLICEQVVLTEAFSLSTHSLYDKHNIHNKIKYPTRKSRLHSKSSTSTNLADSTTTTRENFLQRMGFWLASLAATTKVPFLQPASALSTENDTKGPSFLASVSEPSSFSPKASISSSPNADLSKATIAYRDIKMKIPSYDVSVPVAVWFPPSTESDTEKELTAAAAAARSTLKYNHRISVQRIGDLLAGMDFIPKFVSKDFCLTPTTTSASVVDGQGLTIPSGKPLILLAHGYLGSRFDLSHLAEALAEAGFVCVSPEYPESLAASYPRSNEGLDRQVINQHLIDDTIPNILKTTPKRFGIVGHSLGCGTATRTGNGEWTRVCIAGPPVRKDGVRVDGNIMAIASLNDGLVTRSRLDSMIPQDFVRLQESNLATFEATKALPSRCALVLDREDAPNHISFLAGNVNDSMVSFLSPLLPVAQTLKIPVLDFDKYKESRDSEATAKVILPLISSFLEQHMA